MLMENIRFKPVNSASFLCKSQWKRGYLSIILTGHVLPGSSNLEMVLLVHHLTSSSFQNGNLNYIKVIVVTVT